LAEALPGLSVRGFTTWNKGWSNADALAREAITDILNSEPLMEAGLAREIGRHSPSDCALYVSNSMPVRDIDSFMEPRSRPPLVFANRGASGIDGLLSSAAGVAASGTPTILLTGDLAFYHDVGGLLAVADADIDLTIVVANNSGGGIFSFLPIAGSIGPDVLDTVFTTPQSHDISALSAGAGVRHNLLTDLRSVRRAIAERTTAVRVHELPVDRTASVDQHRRIVDAVASALT
jgi:2-succinyl-5-enolpyruvyl-6-hydroxy-3-cyclohexene-1-carboxylate synthase